VSSPQPTTISTGTTQSTSATTISTENISGNNIASPIPDWIAIVASCVAGFLVLLAICVGVAVVIVCRRRQKQSERKQQSRGKAKEMQPSRTMRLQEKSGTELHSARFSAPDADSTLYASPYSEFSPVTVGESESEGKHKQHYSSFMSSEITSMVESNDARRHYSTLTDSEIAANTDDRQTYDVLTDVEAMKR
jgi:flagellar biosynthesis/type III secretory pathway M-ring protein FliF/YscJ